MKQTIRRKLIDDTNPVYDIWEEEHIAPDYTAETVGGGPETQEDSDLIEAIEGVSGQPGKVKLAYTKEGDYIGSVKTARRLCDEKASFLKRAVRTTRYVPSGSARRSRSGTAGVTAPSTVSASVTWCKRVTAPRHQAGRTGTWPDTPSRISGSLSASRPRPWMTRSG